MRGEGRRVGREWLDGCLFGPLAGCRGGSDAGEGPHGAMGSARRRMRNSSSGEVEGEPDEGHWGSGINVRNLLR